MAEPYMTPDMQAAGVQQPEEPMSQAGLVDALRSRGTLPSGLPQSMGAGAGQANAGLAFGSGVLNALSGGNAALNPYLAQQQEQQNRQFWQQQHMMQAQARERDRQAKREEAAYNISKDLLRSEQPEARMTGAQGVSRYMRSLGMQSPDGLIKALATRRLSETELNAMYRDVHLGMADPEILAKYPSASPTDVQQVRASKDNAIILKSLGLRTPEEQLKFTYDMRISAAKATEAEHPELRGDANTVGAIQMKHRELFQKDYAEGDPVSQHKAYAAAIADKQAREDAVARMRGEMELNKLLQGITLRAETRPDPTQKPVPPQIKQKMIEPFAKAQSVFKGVDMVKEATDELEKIGALPKGNDVASMYAAKLKRATVLRSHPALVKFQQLWGPVSIGQIDRGLFDEKGVRAIAAFSKQLDAVDNMPTAAALHGYLDTVKREIERANASRIEDMEALDNMPPDVIQRVKAIHMGMAGGAVSKKGPLNPEKDPLGILR